MFCLQRNVITLLLSFSDLKKKKKKKKLFLATLLLVYEFLIILLWVDAFWYFVVFLNIPSHVISAPLIALSM
jgi:cytoskeletal protein RodZ